MLKYPKPYSNETLLSFIYRVAEENKMESSSWILHCFKKSLSVEVIENLVNWLCGSDLDEIANYLKIPLKQAQSLTVINDLKKLNLEVNNITKNQWFLYSKTRYCPLCLKDGAYQRKDWINSHSIICLRHNSFLLDTCTTCQKQINVTNIIQDNCSSCNKKLSFSHIYENDMTILFLYQQTINQIFNEDKFTYEHSWINTPIQFLKSLDFFALWISKLVDSSNISIPNKKIYFDGNVIERHTLKNFKTIEQTICLFNFSFKILSNWPVNFYAFLESIESTSNLPYKSFLKYGVPKLINTDLWHISKAVTSYITSNKLNLCENEYIRSDEIKYFNTKFQGNILHSNLLESHKINYYGISYTFVRRKDVNNIFKKFGLSYSKEELRVHWGTSSRATTSILKSGLLKNVISYQSGSANTWLIPTSSVVALEQRIYEKCTSIIKEEAISLSKAFEWVGPDNANLIIKGILTGKIKVQFTDKFSETIIAKRDCYYFSREDLIAKSKKLGYFIWRDLVFILGVKKSDLDYWFDTGRFGKSISIHQLTESSVIKFLNDYITTYELSMYLEIPVKKLLKRHQSGYFNSYSGPSYNDGKRLLFKRDDFIKISNSI
ncbi:TniQ family protein (plasmid) [Metabacillus halosaccharovorans]|uniref:TniQ family protein n=1 Tax=Bacillaceae TaxID=186817 RepID=UPI000C767304|nr:MULTISPECIES: TniQ family protein [Bacillaceae]MCM3443550.1 TniQ family protein [Metabacillus halosaccharovorans]PLR67999.1 hypothetical protein CYJ36_11835 [Bacillus sp. UMB0893]PMC35016.1 hypothetical protein CJ195_21160 [Bacillus sp. UMB0899]